MNIYKKYCPNVFVAACDEEYKKGDIIEVVTRYEKMHKCIVHNFVGFMGTKEFPLYCYSIIRCDGFNSQVRAERRAQKLNELSEKAKNKSNEFYEASKEGHDFLALGEPIKVGHHSEKRHRALIERNNSRMRKSIEEIDKSSDYKARSKYWEDLSNKIDLSMPESIVFFQSQLEKAQEYHKGLKDGSIAKAHSYSLAYAKKKVNDLTKKVEIAKKLWAND